MSFLETNKSSKVSGGESINDPRFNQYRQGTDWLQSLDQDQEASRSQDQHFELLAEHQAIKQKFLLKQENKDISPQSDYVKISGDDTQTKKIPHT